MKIFVEAMITDGDWCDWQKRHYQALLGCNCINFKEYSGMNGCIDLNQKGIIFCDPDVGILPKSSGNKHFKISFLNNAKGKLIVVFQDLTRTNESYSVKTCNNKNVLLRKVCEELSNINKLKMIFLDLSQVGFWFFTTDKYYCSLKRILRKRFPRRIR
ncbi:MAG: hypothetical protein NTW26_00175 [bacterium]|nr:hypothetical protein [bacterium]